MNALIQSLKSRTIWLAIVISVLGILEQNASLVSQLVGPENVGFVMVGISLCVAVLRVVTSRPLIN